MNNTIVSLITAPINAAVAVIRLSGDNSLEIAQNIFSRKIEKPNYAYVGKLVNNNEIIDEVVLIYYKAPRSFTGEDVVEISIHGSMLIANEVISLIIAKGARLAQRGEFSSRAYYNNKIDLVQAEAIMSMVEATSIEAKKLALYSLEGDTSKLIKPLIDKLADILSNIEVNIDYPEYEDIEVMTNDIVLKNISKIELEIKDILEKSEDGRIIKEGIKTIIIGKPNVGKSSLLNNLINEEKAIVTDIAGTTRDIVEGKIIIDGVVLDLIDTAGIRHTNDVVESIGVKKSIDLIDTADLIIYMLNGNEEIDESDIEILNKIKDKNHIVVINKIDLEEKVDYNKICTNEIIKMSISKNIGIDDLKNKIKELFNLEKLKTRDLNFLTNARSISILKECQKLIISVKEGIKNNYPIDIVEIDIKRIWELLGEIIGETYQDELINQLFSQFCLGK